MNLLLGWDYVEAHTGKFTDVDATNLYCNSLYEYDSSHKADAIATQQWVAEQILNAMIKLVPHVSNAQSTGNKAYGVAKHHSHNEHGVVISDSWR